jgi:predicted O-linked N-acetylglucosamine transferase (SPINDLY family)/glycosyltransferase involved in cell wall biosynthesis/predicted SAM-dependent methyltransferase
MTSEINQIIPPEIKHDEFYEAIKQIAREEDIKTILEIGSSSGAGSTEAFVTGIRENPHQPQLFCMEISQERFTELQKRYAKDYLVKCYNVSSVGINQFAQQQEVINFYHSYQTALNQYPLEQVLDWLRQDRQYLQNSAVSQAGIKKIKSENNIIFFDVVLIDGSEFTGEAELDEVYGAKFILLDDINTFKNYKNYHKLLNDPNYKILAESFSIRHGYAVFRKLESAVTCSNSLSENNIALIPAQIKNEFSPKEFSKPLASKTLDSDGLKLMSKSLSHLSLKNKNAIESLFQSGKPIKLELGASEKRMEGWTTIDLDPRSDLCLDLSQPLPFPDNCVEQIYSSHLLEHFSYPCPMVNLLSECYRVLQPGGVFKVAVPNARIYIEAYGKPESFDAQEYCLYKPAFHYHSKIDFINYIAYMDGHHRFLFDEENLPKIIANAGFEDVRLRSFETGLDLEERKHESIYVEGTKPLADTKPLSIHFFTIVLNGEPFIRYHIDVLKNLPFRWHWHIVEGVADLKHDTAWSVTLGGSISDDIHREGLSQDGTREYLDELARLYPENITIYRKPEGAFWEGKREMINAPLAPIREECLLWQIDVDELWTFEQICQTRQMFIEHPEKTAAFYWCWYFVGENLVISTRNCYANNPQYEWLRTWRFKPGMVWATHEPPRLAEPLPNGKWRDVAAVNPFSHQETEKEGLIFQHFAYVTENQLRFKEQYYGYKNATSQWLNLQQQTQFPVLLRQYFNWVKDDTQVNSTIACGVEPLAQGDINTKSWQFKTASALPALPVKPREKSPKIVIDGVFFQLNNTGIARVWKSLWEEWANTNFAQNIIILDRNGTAPKIPGLRYRTIPLYDYGNTERDRAMLQEICNEEKADLFISTYYTTPKSTRSVFMAYDMIPEIIGQQLEQGEWREKHYAIRHASAFITISQNTSRDLLRCFPQISPDTITVAHCGINQSFSPATSSEIQQFCTKYNITKPYFLFVGDRVGWYGYKNAILFFKAFDQLPNKANFEIICVGGKSQLEKEFLEYTSGVKVQILPLDDSELKKAYSGAIGLIYPSKYEGFGLPVLEAMACGCPVITCAKASLPEVAGKAALYVGENDVNGMKEALLTVQKTEIRQSLIEAGLAQSQQFSWSKMANIISFVLLETAQKTSIKVSAIVSVYNAEKFIQGCLEDLINQTLYQKGQLEIIVIDSNSPQKEGAIVQTFQAKYPHIIYERTAERETLYDAWNRAISKAKGVYITNANADDRHRPDALEIMANYLDKKSDIVLVYGDQLITNIANDNWATTNADKRWNWPEFSYSELERRCIIGSQPLWRKSIHEKYGYFRGEFACAGDYEFWLRIGKTEKISRIPEILGLHYYNQQGLENSSSRSDQETLKIWDEYGIRDRGIQPKISVPIPMSKSELNSLRDRASTAPLVSVIIPCYNHATFLREAVESVVNQTYQNCECIIVNDGSTDDTSALAEYLKNLYQSKTISIINKENTGPADSRNVGVQKSSGLFILFLDADDKIHPNFISECLQVLLEKNTVGFVYTDVQHFGFNCNLVVHGDFDINTFVRDNQAPATSLFRREIYEQVGGLKKVMKLGCEDWEFWISAYEKGWQGYRLPKPYLYYRQHGDGSSRTQKMVRDRVTLDLMRAVIIHLHSALYNSEEIRWGEKILSQNYYLIAEELKQLNNTQESLSVSIEKAWEAYQKEAGNDSAIENLRQARFQLAQKWLNSTLEELANDYGSDLGKLHQKLCQSGLKQEPLTEKEQKLINQLISHLSTGLKDPNTSAYLLAGMLYRRADQLAFNYENAAIPNWLVNDYLKFMFTTPDLFQEIGESNNYYHYIQGWYQYLHQKILSNSETPLWQQVAWFFTQFHNFIPLYFNTENLKKVYSQRGDIIEYALKKRGASIDYIFPARPLERQKIRLGILTKHFGAMTETFATLPAFEYLDRNHFEIILYAINLNGNALEKYCQQRADKLVKLSDDLANQVQTIRGDDLDILLIGTNVAAVTHPITLLAIHRLARIQVTCFNSPVTTGIRNIDYYIAGKLMEPSPESPENYREKLVTIEGVGCCFSYNMEPYSATVTSNRKNIGISEDAIVFISSANFFKLIPELRETWAKILAKVPNSFLVLMPFGPSWTNAYPAVNFVKNMESILQKYGVESNRLRVLKAFPNRADVKEVLKLADVYLDSYPYAGTTSLVDPLEVALPTVVQEGNKLRSRMGAALLRSLSINDLITNNEESYIQLAVSLATNPQLRQQKREEIAQKMQNNPPFLDSRAYSLSFGNLLKDLFQQWQNSQGGSEKMALSDSQFVLNVNQVMGCVNLYQIDPSVESVVTELRQIRQKFANLWLMTPSEKLEKIYESEIGKAYQVLLKSGIQNEELTQEEQIFVQQLTQLTKGLIHPQALNGLLASMLYFKPGTMRIPNADNRLPHWLISDYKNIFETGIVTGNQDVTEEKSTYLLQVQYMTSPLFLNQLLGTINLYRIDSSDQGVVMELRQLRKQLADFWILTPPEKLQSLYQSDLNKAYYALLRSGIVKESMLEAEKTFFTSLITEVSKGMTESNSMNYLLAILLYCRPGQLKVQDANTSLPPWFLSDYETFVRGGSIPIV